MDALEKIAAGEHAVVLSDAVDPLPETEWPGKDIDLTEREAEVIGLIAQGYSNEEIARLCYLSINTVKTYIRSAYRKAGVNTQRSGRRLGAASRIPSGTHAVTVTLLHMVAVNIRPFTRLSTMVPRSDPA